MSQSIIFPLQSQSKYIEGSYQTFNISLRSQFYKNFKGNTFSNYHIQLKDFERWIGKKIDEFFNPASAIIEHQEKHLRKYLRSSERENKSTNRTFGTWEASDS